MDWANAVKAAKDNYLDEVDTCALLRHEKLSFTRLADEFFGLSERLLVFCDRAHRVIGLKPCAKDDPRGYKITRPRDKKRRSCSRSISISGLCNRFDLNIPRKLTCPVTRQDEMLVVHLDKDEADTPKKYNWEEVKKGLKTTFLKPRVTIIVHRGESGPKSYDASFNEAVFRALGSPVYVEPGYDKRSKEFGLRAAPTNAKTALKVRPIYGSNPGVCFPTYLLHFSGLLSNAKFVIEKSLRFVPKIENGAVTFFLIDGVLVKSAPGRPQKLYDDKDAELFKLAVKERDDYARLHKGARITRGLLASRLGISVRSLNRFYTRLKTDHKSFVGPNPRRRPSSKAPMSKRAKRAKN